MNQFINVCVTGLNSIGRGFYDYSTAMFLQVGILAAVLLAVDLLLRHRIRATVRYWIWMLVFIKLLLPPSLGMPTGIGYWCGRCVPRSPTARDEASGMREDRVTSPAPPLAPEALFLGDGAALATEPLESVLVHREHLTWHAILLLLWGVGVLALGGMVIQRLFFVRRLIAQGLPAPDDVLDVLDQCCRRMGLRRKVELRLSPDAFSPAVCGLLRPTILLPPMLVERLSPDKLKAVLIHELAHIQRADLWVNSFQTVLQIFYFYSPLVWLAHAIVRRVREQAVDEMVLVALGAEARSYGTTLIDIAEMTFLRAPPALGLVGVAESKKSLEGRIKHMMTRPTPKKANVGVWGIVVILSAAAVLLPMAQARNPTPQSANTDKPNGGYRILLLDDKDAQFWSKEQYDDRLYLIDPKGRIEGAVTGFNLCQSPGGCHALAVDAERRTLWVADNRGRRLWHFDLAGGKLLRQVPLSRVDAVALDPATGNAWCLVSEGPIDAGSLQVISPAGEPLAKYPIVGLDIAYSRHDASFWIVGKDIVKVSREGKVLGRIAGRIPWYAVSVSMDQKTGNAWVVIRDHPQVAESKPQVWVVDPEMDVRTAIELGDLTPFCVAVDSGHGIAWVGCYGTTLRFTTKGEKLPSARGASGFSVAAGGPSDPVLVAGERGLAVAATPEAGRLWLTFPPDDLRGLLSSSHKWVAIVPWGGAKLPSSPELADLIDSEPTRVEEQKAHPITVMGHLRQVVPAAMAYAEEHQGRFASDLAELKPYFGDDARFVQIVDNVEYLGKGVQQAELTAGGSRPLAYWKTTTTNDCIAVVFFDGHAEVVKSDRLAELGIDPKP